MVMSINFNADPSKTVCVMESTAKSACSTLILSSSYFIKVLLNPKDKRVYTGIIIVNAWQ